MCNQKTKEATQQVARELRAVARVVVTPHVGGLEEHLDNLVDRLEGLVGKLEMGDIRAHQGVIDAWHHTQLALVLLRKGSDCGPLSPRLVVQAYLRVASYRAYHAWQVLEASGWGAPKEALREACAVAATPSGVVA